MIQKLINKIAEKAVKNHIKDGTDPNKTIKTELTKMSKLNKEFLKK